MLYLLCGIATLLIQGFPTLFLLRHRRKETLKITLTPIVVPLQRQEKLCAKIVQGSQSDLQSRNDQCCLNFELIHTQH